MSDKCKHGVRDTTTNLPYCLRCDDESKGYGHYVTDFQIIRDKISSLRVAFLGNQDHRAMAIEAELSRAQQSMEEAIRHEKQSK